MKEKVLPKKLKPIRREILDAVEKSYKPPMDED
jgi:hypothetical protein